MKVRFGLLGCGNIAHRFAQALQLSQYGELYATAARDISRAQAMAEQYGGQKAYGSYQELVQDDQVEIVYISLVHNLHYEAAKLCVEHGKTVICEKPFFVNEAEGLALAKLAREKGVLVMEAMWTKCLPTFLQAKAWLTEGRIGDAKLIEAAFCFHTAFDPKNRLFNPDTAGGALLDVGVYPYQYITGLLNEFPADIKAVAQSAPTGVDETVCLTMSFASGAVSIAKASIGVKTDDTAYIYGTDGCIKVYQFYGSQKCELFDSKGMLLETFTDPHENGFVYQIDHIAELYQAKALDSPLLPMAYTLDFAHAADIARKQW